MFWTDWGVNPKIERAGMNGQQRQVIVSTDMMMWPNGLAIDYFSELLFWVDAKLHTLSSCDFDGLGRRTIINSASILPHPFSVTVFEDSVYWSDWEKEGIFKANKFDGSERTQLISDLFNPMNLRIMHPVIQSNCKYKFGEKKFKKTKTGCSCVFMGGICINSPTFAQNIVKINFNLI